MDPFEHVEDAHSEATFAGDTEANPNVEEYYICFTCVDGELYPIPHGSSSPTSLLKDATEVIKEMIHTA